MKTIEYCPMGIAIADASCEDIATQFLTNQFSTYMNVSNETFITVVRGLICDGICDHKDVRFLFEGKYIQPDIDGRLPVWPVGFCDITEKVLCGMLRGHFAKNDV
jgi:hypothetical protein